MTRLLLLLSLTLAALTGAPAVADAPAPPPRTSWMRHPCVDAAAVDCFRDAGHAHYVRRFRHGPTCVMYVERRYARHHDYCGLVA